MREPHRDLSEPVLARILCIGLLVLAGAGCSQPTAAHVVSSEPVVTGRGLLDSSRIDQYQSLAILTLEDAPSAPGSGTVVAELVSDALLDLGFTLVERSRLKQLFAEQRLELRYGDQRQRALHVGRLAGARAMVMGRVDRWPGTASDETDIDVTAMAFTLELVDVETGTILYGGQASYSHPVYVQRRPEELVHALLRNWVAKLAIATGLSGTGLTGFQWVLTQRGAERVAVVTQVHHGLPAEQMGLRVGDRLLACNGVEAAEWHTLWESLRACQVDAGNLLALTVERDGGRMVIHIKAVDLLAFLKNQAMIPM